MCLLQVYRIWDGGLKSIEARRSTSGQEFGVMDPTSRRYVTKVGLGEGQLRLFEGAL